MTIKVAAFGIVKEIFGRASIEMQVDDGTTIEILKSSLSTHYPGLTKLSSFMIAVNGEYALSSHLIVSGEEVAIIPPVSGG